MFNILWAFCQWQFENNIIQKTIKVIIGTLLIKKRLAYVYEYNMYEVKRSFLLSFLPNG